MQKFKQRLAWLLAGWLSTSTLTASAAQGVQPAIPVHSPPTASQHLFAQMPPGIQVFEPPEQFPLSDFAWQTHGKFQLGPTDRIYMRGVVLSVKRYLVSDEDEMADIAPFDVVIGWQRMSDPAIIRQVHILQQERFYYWRVEDFPIPRDEIELTSTNVHVIPDSAEQWQQLAQLQVGSVVSMYGLLTDVKTPDGFVWSTSRVRDDHGDGACEILWLHQLSVLRAPNMQALSAQPSPESPKPTSP